MNDLNDEGISVQLYSNVVGNPTGTNVNEGVDHYKKNNCDGVIAFGGGSGIDVGKAIAFMAGQSIALWEFEDVGENWKKANILMGNNTDDVQIFISVDKLENWVKALNKLNSLPGIKKITTQKLTNEGAFVTVTVEGGLNRFISIVFENKLPFSGPKEKLILNSDKL